MSKNIWIINQYLTTPKLNGNGYRHSYLADHFVNMGYDVTLITSSFSHVPRKDYRFKGLFKVLEGNYRTLLVRGNRYAKSKGFYRILSWLIFCLLLFIIPKRKIPKPDIILISSMSLLPILNVVFYYKKIYRKAKFILEIRDIWPLTIIELGGYSKNNFFVKVLAWVEKLGYKKANHIVSVLQNADKHIEQVLGHKYFKFSWISNGYQLQDINQNVKLSEEILKKIPKNKFIVGYAGTLGKANAMHYIIEAMNGLNDEIALCILGSGNEKKHLQELSTTNNVVFIDKIPKTEVLAFLKHCDILYIGWYNSKIYNYGISAQKIFEYMFSEKPILMSGDFIDNPISLAKCGFVVPAENSDLIRDALIEIKEKPSELLEEIGNEGKAYLLENFTYQHLAQRYASEVFEEE